MAARCRSLRNELVDEALGVNPAQAVLADTELPGVVADDNRVLQQPPMATAPHSAPSVAIRTGSGVTFISPMSNRLES